MSSAPPILEKLINELSKMPGIGRKSAQRLALYVLKQNSSDINELATVLMDVKRRIGECKICFNLTESTNCDVCSSERRDRSTICIVEEPTDIMAIEQAGDYRGLYHVLGGVISPLDGIGPADLKIDELLDRLEGVQEIIIATNPSIEGETTTLYLQKELNARNLKVTRIARGIPMGSALEHTDQVTLMRAFEGRIEIKEEQPN